MNSFTGRTLWETGLPSAWSLFLELRWSKFGDSRQEMELLQPLQLEHIDEKPTCRIWIRRDDSNSHVKNGG